MTFFNNVNTSFFYQLFLMDFIALFLTRVSSALVIGREKYNALTDTMRQKRSKTQQRWHQAKENISGLNWQNAKETLVREGLTAPGCLLLPSLAFLGTQKLLGGKAQEMTQRNFNSLYDGMLHHLNNTPNSSLSQTNKALLNQIFDTTHNPELQKIFTLPLKAGGTNALEAFQKLGRQEQLKNIVIPEALLNPYAKEGQSAQSIRSVQQFIDNWSEKWISAVDAKHNGQKPAISHKQLIQDFNTLFHKHILTLTQDKPLKRGQLPLSQFVRQTVKNGQVTGQIEVAEQSIEQALKNLSNFTDYIRQTYRRATKYAGVNQLGQHLIEHAAHARNRLLHHKFFTTLGALAISAGWLYIVPKLSQSHDKYPAIRHLTQRANTTAAYQQNIISIEQLRQLVALQQLKQTSAPIASSAQQLGGRS